jgi:hypothetical protein
MLLLSAGSIIIEGINLTYHNRQKIAGLTLLKHGYVILIKNMDLLIKRLITLTSY